MFGHAGRGRAAGANGDGQKGQALLELALVTPILVVLFMAIFQFAYVMESQIGLTNAVREAARRVAASTNPVPTWTGPGSLEEWVQIELCGDLTPPCSGGLLRDNVQGFDGTKLVTDPPAVSFCSYDVGGVTNYQVQVDVAYGHPLFFGPMAFATDLIDGTPGNGSWDLAVSAQMHMEADFDQAAPGWTDPGPCS